TLRRDADLLANFQAVRVGQVVVGGQFLDGEAVLQADAVQIFAGLDNVDTLFGYRRRGRRLGNRLGRRGWLHLPAQRDEKLLPDVQRGLKGQVVRRGDLLGSDAVLLGDAAQRVAGDDRMDDVLGHGRLGGRLRSFYGRLASG